VLRVSNGSDEDMAYVIGMNRLRAAYAEFDAGIDRYFIASKHDDDQGISQTYAYSPHGSSLVQPLASRLMFVLVVSSVASTSSDPSTRRCFLAPRRRACSSRHSPNRRSRRVANENAMRPA